MTILICQKHSEMSKPKVKPVVTRSVSVSTDYVVYDVVYHHRHHCRFCPCHHHLTSDYELSALTNAQTCTRTDRHIQTDTHTYIHTYIQTDRHTYRQTQRQTDTQTCTHTDRHIQTDTQTDTHTYRQTHIQTDIHTQTDTHTYTQTDRRTDASVSYTCTSKPAVKLKLQSKCEAEQT